MFWLFLGGKAAQLQPKTGPFPIARIAVKYKPVSGTYPEIVVGFHSPILDRYGVVLSLGW